MRTIGLIIVRSLRQHLLSTIITALSIALAGGLLMSVWVVKVQSQTTFTQVNTGFDAVLGARSSKLQLVLNAIFHLEASPGNLDHANARESLALIRDTCRENGAALLLVSHDPGVLGAFEDVRDFAALNRAVAEAAS